MIGGVAFPPTQHPDALVRVYDAATGAFEWGDRLVSFVPGNPQNEGPGGEFGTLALEVGKGRVFITTGGVARAYDLKTGAQLWEFSFSDPVYDLHVFPQRNLPKALRLLGNRLFVGVTRHGTPKGFPPELGLPPATFRVQALDARTGALLWTSDGPVAWDDNCTFPGPRALATGWGLVFAVGMGQLGPPPVDDFCGEIPNFKPSARPGHRQCRLGGSASGSGKRHPGPRHGRHGG